MSQAPQDTCLVDITPRKVQHFKPDPGTLLSWENRDFETGDVLESGEITVDEWGLFTIEQTMVSKEKNRIVIWESLDSFN